MKTSDEIKLNVFQCLERISKVVKINKDQQSEFLAHVLHKLHAEKCEQYVRGRFDHYELDELKVTLDIVGGLNGPSTGSEKISPRTKR